MTLDEANQYTWWSDFLEARTNAIRAMRLLHRNQDDIVSTLSLEDNAHLIRIMLINGIE